MKKNIINGRFLLHKITGVERYAREIVAELDKIIEPGSFILAVPPETTDIPEYKNIKVKKIGKLHGRLWEQLSFPRYVHSENGVSLNLCNVAPLISPGIVCIHDVKVKATPQCFSKKFLIWYNLLFFNETKRAKEILTVSNFSKNEIMKYYKVNSNKIQVVPDAWQHYERICYDEKTLKKYELHRNDYFFAMGSMDPNKNFKWIAEVAKRTPQYTFVIAGAINEKVFAEGFGFECTPNMKLVGYVSDGEAKVLMRDCKAFLFPSFYEGFGIPPLEAICAGTNQVVVSNTEIMHEILGDGVVYVNPLEYNFDFDTITQLDEFNRNQIMNKYSWRASAKRLKKIVLEEMDRQRD